MNKTVKVISTILMVILLVSMFSSVVMASGSAADKVDSIKSSVPAGAESKINTLAGNIIGVLTTVGIAVAVIILLILGIKYMMGSASEKAEYKKTMIPYLVGAILIFGASGIAKIVISMTSFTGKP